MTTEPVDILSTSSSELDLTLTRDDTELFFASNRSGNYWIYRSYRVCD